MVDIQVRREQEERKSKDDAAFEKIEDFNVTSNAEEKFCGSDYIDMTFDMKLQLGGKERNTMYAGVYAMYEVVCAMYERINPIFSTLLSPNSMHSSIPAVPSS